MSFDAEKIVRETVGNVLGFYHHMALRLHWGGSADNPVLPLESSPLGEEIRLLVRVANGEIDRDKTDDMQVYEVGDTIQSICETLFVAPAGAYSYWIPDSFWASELGQIISLCQLWIDRDTLITQSEAAVILFGSATDAALVKVRRLIDNEKLRRYLALDEPNPQRSGRLSRKSVEALKTK